MINLFQLPIHMIQIIYAQTDSNPKTLATLCSISNKIIKNFWKYFLQNYINSECLLLKKIAKREIEQVSKLDEEQLIVVKIFYKIIFRANDLGYKKVSFRMSNLYQLENLAKWIQDREANNLRLFLSTVPKNVSPKGIVYINLSNLGLRAIPEEIGQFQNIISINASNNQLDFLPKNFSLLSSLTTLMLNDNNFTSFPDVLFNLDRLAEIQLKLNPLDYASAYGRFKQVKIGIYRCNKPAMTLNNQKTCTFKIFFNTCSSVKSNLE